MAVKRNKKGQVESGSVLNPNGRPKSKTLSEWYRYHLSQPSAEDPTRTNADIIAETHVNAAKVVEGIGAAKEIADRTEGKPRQAVDLQVDDRRRAALETIINGLIATGMDEQQAKDYLAGVVPETREWIN